MNGACICGQQRSKAVKLITGIAPETGMIATRFTGLYHHNHRRLLQANAMRFSYSLSYIMR
jgi:hypothetical protein